jgi:hypothetical protein
MVKKLVLIVLSWAAALLPVPTNVQNAMASTLEKPTVVSFTMTPGTVDLTQTHPLVSIDLIVKSPTGVITQQTVLTLDDGASHKILVPLIRTDNPLNGALTMVKFHGQLDASKLPAGAYAGSAAPVTSLKNDGSAGYPTDTLYPTTDSKVVGAENYLLIRSAGDLSYAYPTFNGPTFDHVNTDMTLFLNPKYKSVPDPMWNVGEVFNPADYYELDIPSLSLKVSTTTPTKCSTDGTTLKLIAEGPCSFTISTPKTTDYQEFKDLRTITVNPARTKPVLTISQIPTQSSDALPLSISGPYVQGPTGVVIPSSATPSVCTPVGFFIYITSGGTCTLTYATAGTSEYRPSDVYTMTFQITRTTQTLSFVAPTTLGLATKSVNLSATASSGQLVTFASTTPTICSVTGNSLNLFTAGTCRVTASQIGTAKIAPVSLDQSIVITSSSVAPQAAGKAAPKPGKKLVCIKRGKIKTVTSKTCPSGYKPKQ